tara:strand:- start:623 stop:1147 length:525 start_codon:yes stop_codon:yes gene_type:complete
MKKAQTIGQVFIYIIAAVTFGLITIFGYNAIASFLEQGDEIAMVSLKNDLELQFERMATDYGSVRERSFTTPSDFRTICFVDFGNDESTPLPNSCDSEPFDIIACSLWRPGPGYDNAQQNVFFTPPGEIPIKLAPFEISDSETENHLCLPTTNGQFRLRLEGLGDRVKVSKVTN